MPTLGCIISFQMRVPMTGATIMGKIKVVCRIFASRVSRLSNMAMPSPSSSSTVVADSAYFRVMVVLFMKPELWIMRS